MIINQTTNYLNTNHYNDLSPEQVADLVIEKEQKDFPHRKRDWEERKVLYITFESIIRENPDRIPTCPWRGPLHYGMTLEKMKNAIEQKLCKMIASNQMFRESSIIIRKEFYPPDDSQRDLTRIWGADYLKSQLMDYRYLDAPQHFLIVDDDAKEIEIWVKHSKLSYHIPTLSKVKNGGYVLSVKIEGKPVASKHTFGSPLKRIGFTDYSNEDNILRDTNGVDWVVDTEGKSFEDPFREYPEWYDNAFPEIDPTNHALLKKYLEGRFAVLAGKDYHNYFQIFKISLADIGLK